MTVRLSETCEYGVIAILPWAPGGRDSGIVTDDVRRTVVVLRLVLPPVSRDALKKWNTRKLLDSLSLRCVS